MLLHYEFKANINAYLGGLGPNVVVHSLLDVIDFDEKHRDSDIFYFRPEAISIFRKGPADVTGICGVLSRRPPSG